MNSLAPPQEFFCPLTKKIMEDPVVSRYGHSFDRKAILEWLGKGHNYCPVTGNPLRPSNLVSNASLKWKIDYWNSKAGRSKPVQKESKDDDDGLDSGSAHAATVVTAYVSPPPAKFICPITKEIMKDPVMSKHGQNFERKAILSHLEKSDQCPVTKKPLLPSNVVTNSKLQWEIRQWQLSYGDASEEMSRLELETKLSKAEMVSLDFHMSDILRVLSIDAESNHGTTKRNNRNSITVDTISENPSDGKPNAKRDSLYDRSSVLDLLDEVVDTLE